MKEVTAFGYSNPHRAEHKYGPGTIKTKFRESDAETPVDGISSGRGGVSCLSTGLSDGRPPERHIRILKTNEEEPLDQEQPYPIYNKVDIGSDSDSERDQTDQKEMEEMLMSEEETEPDEVKRFPAGGVSNGRGGASCLPAGVFDGRLPLTESMIRANQNNAITENPEPESPKITPTRL